MTFFYAENILKCQGEKLDEKSKSPGLHSCYELILIITCAMEPEFLGGNLKLTE